MEKAIFPPRDRPLKVAVCSLTLASQKLRCRNTEPIRQIEKPLIEQAAFAEFDIDQNVSRHAREQRQLLLGEPTLQAECANP